MRHVRSAKPGDHSWSARLGLQLAALLAVLLAIVPAPRAAEVEADHPFRFGFSAKLMSTMNENDSRAAMKAWANTLVKSGALEADPTVLFCRDFATMREALLARQVDGAAILTAELFTLRDEVPFNRFVFAVVDGEIADEYVVLVRRNKPYTRLADLERKPLRLHANPRLALALVWLDTRLIPQGLKPASEFFLAIEEEPKLAKTVLPVFFGTAEACVVTRKGFAAMADMNPQVGQQLRVLTNSPALLPSGFFFRQGYPQKQQDRCLEEFTSIHTTQHGQQILTVFQTQRLEERPLASLETTFALLETHRRLTQKHDTLPPTAADLLGSTNRPRATLP